MKELEDKGETGSDAYKNLQEELNKTFDPANYKSDKNYTDLLNTIDSQRESVMNILIGSNLSKMVNMTFDEFKKELGKIYTITDENGNEKTIIPFNDEEIEKLLQSFRDTKIDLYKSLRITPAEIIELENNYKKFTADLSKTKFETVGIGLDGDASKLYNIQKRFNAELS